MSLDHGYGNHDSIRRPPPLTKKTVPTISSLEGKNVRPHKALKMGLVDQLVDPASLEAVAVDAAASLASGTLKAKRKSKSVVNRLIEDNPAGRSVMWKKVGAFRYCFFRFFFSFLMSSRLVIFSGLKKKI